MDPFDPLVPDDVTAYASDGTTPLAVLSKTAKRTAADTWQVNLNVKAMQPIQSSPLYMEFLLDNSGSMTDEKIGSRTRLAVMKDAVCDVLDVLSVSSADIYIHFTTFNGSVSDLNIGQGTLTQVPTNMRPEPNCGNGRWVNTIPADYVVKGLDPVTYSYTYEHNADPASGKPIVTFTGTEDGNGDAQLDKTQLEMEKGATLTADLNGGTWEGKGWTKNPDGTWSIDVNQNLNVPDPDAREGYQFGGWAVTGPDKDGNILITALWTELETKVEVKVAGDFADKVKVDPACLDDIIDKVVDEEISEGNQLKKVEVVMTVKNHDSSSDTAANAIKAIADGRTLDFYDILIDKIVTYAVWDGTSWTALKTNPDWGKVSK